MKVKALMTLDKLWVFFMRLMITFLEGLTGLVEMRLTDLVTVSLISRDEQGTVGQLDLL